jgi:peptide/nickel transport system permease protein
MGRFQTGFVLIMLSFLFCLCSAPDKSENANQMHLSIHSKPPGFQVDMLSIPLDRKPYKSLSNYFIGFPNTVTEVAIESYKVIGSTIEYVEYSTNLR